MTGRLGWRSAFENQGRWLEDVIAEIPWPGERMIPAADSSPLELAFALQEIRRCIWNCQVAQGIAIGRAWALNKLTKTASSVKFLAQLPGKEQEELPGNPRRCTGHGRTARGNQRFQVQAGNDCPQFEAGLIDAYEKALETTSRLITAVELM